MPCWKEVEGIEKRWRGSERGGGGGGGFSAPPLIRTSFCDPLPDFRPVFKVNCDEGLTRKYKMKNCCVTKFSCLMVKNFLWNPLSDFRPVFGSNCDEGMTRKYKRHELGGGLFSSSN